jgi:hypothetical protein
MNHKKFSSFYILKSLLGVFFYCLMVIIFLLERSRFSNLYFLYIGNFLFCAWMFLVLIEFTKKQGENAGFWPTAKTGLKITRNVIFFSCIVIVLLLLIDRNSQILRAPANSSGLPPILFVDAIVVNFFVGMFATLYVSIAANRRQKNTVHSEM